MTRFVSALWVLVAVAAVAAACSSDTPTSADDPGDETTAELGDTVTLVTHDSFLVSDEVWEAFAADTGIEVELLQSADVGTMVTEAALTRDDPIADVMFGIDNTFLSRGLDEELFRPYRSPGLDHVDDELELDPEHRVTPVDFGDVCVNYAVGLDGDTPEPTELDQLRSETYAARWVTPNPETSSPGLALLLATVARYGPDGWEDFWADAAANGLAVTPGWTEAYYGEFVAGGGDRTIVTSYASSPAAELVFAEEPIDEPTTAVLDDACFRQIEFAGILANTERVAESEALIDFLLSDTFQNDIPLNMFVYPASTTATLPDVFAAHTPVIDDPLVLDYREIGENRATWTDRWVEIVLR